MNLQKWRKLNKDVALVTWAVIVVPWSWIVQAMQIVLDLPTHLIEYLCNWWPESVSVEDRPQLPGDWREIVPPTFRSK